MLQGDFLVVLAAWLAAASPTSAQEIPPYTGKYNVGKTKHVIPVNNYFDLAPGNISDSFLVTLFYPTLQKSSIPGTTPYLSKGSAAFYNGWFQVPSGTLANLTERILWEAPFESPTGYTSPTLLFQGALGGPHCDLYAIMLSSLASQGYTIAAMDLPYEQPYLQYPDGREFYAPNVTSEDWPGIVANRINNTLSFMQAWPKLSKKLNIKSSTHRFGAFGHSIGGLVALTVAQMVNQSVIPSAVDLDGAVDIDSNLGLNSSAADIKRPSLLLGAQGHNTSIDPSWATYPEWQSSWLRWISINDTAHYDFSDFTFLKDLVQPSPFPQTGDITTSRMLQITNTFISGFFNFTLLGKAGEEGELFNDPTAVFPDTVLRWSSEQASW